MEILYILSILLNVQMGKMVYIDYNHLRMEIGKVSVQQKTKRGWLVGQFFPEDSSFKDENVEIYYKTFPKGDKSDKLHKHPQGKEYLIVLSGKAVMRIGEDELLLEKGDYIAIPNETPDQVFDVLEDFTIMGVRYPSIPNNKIILED